MASVTWCNKAIIRCSLKGEPVEIREACKDAIHVVKSLDGDGDMVTYTITLSDNTRRIIVWDYVGNCLVR